MKKLSDDDILKWLKSDEKANFNAKNRSKPIKKYPKPNQITRETLRKILKGKIKIAVSYTHLTLPTTPYV